MSRCLTVLFALALAPTLVVAADEASTTAAEPTTSPLLAHSRSVFDGVSTILTLSAEMMPEASYDFRPSEDVRSFGEILAHVVDAQYAFCTIARGEEDPERERPDPGSKESVQATLAEAFAYCGTAYDGLTEASAEEMVTFQGGPTPRLGVLNVNQIHNIEHYGNLVTYLRMNDIVPPTSDPEVMKRLMD